MATEPKSPQMAPYVIDEQPGKKVWCGCGYSQKQPYCDGSHSGTGLGPEFVHLDAPKKVAWCGCKKSGNKPYCDGSHSRSK